MEVHYLAGLAAVSHARTLAEGSAARREATLGAKSHFDFVAGHCGELQGQAWERSTELSVVLGVEGKRGQSPFVRSTLRAVPANGDCPLFPDKPASFAQAKAAGDAAWDRMTALRVRAQEAKIRQDQERYASQADQAARQAIGFYRRALAKWPLVVQPFARDSPEDNPVGNALRGVPGVEENRVPPLAAERHGGRSLQGDLATYSDVIPKPAPATDCRNLVRYRLAYLLFATGEYYDAGLLGEFLAQQYPEAADARKAAEIAAEAYRNVVIQRLRSAASAGDGKPLSTEAIRQATASVTERLVRVGRYLIGRWPEEAEAVEAAKLLIDTAVDRREATSAEEFLADVPVASSYRPQAELRVGQAWWGAYVEAAPIVGEDRLPPAELHRLAERAGTDAPEGNRSIPRPAIARLLRRTTPWSTPPLPWPKWRWTKAKPPRRCVGWTIRAIGPMTFVSSGSPASGDLLAMVDQTLLLAVLSYASARLPDKALDALVRLENAGPRARRSVGRRAIGTPIPPRRQASWEGPPTIETGGQSRRGATDHHRARPAPGPHRSA